MKTVGQCGVIFAVIMGMVMLIPPSEDGFKKMVNTSVVVYNESGHGSGVFVGENIILTAGHVAEAHPTHVRLADGTNLEITNIWFHPEYDIGFVWVEGEHAYSDFGQMPRLGDTVYHVGTPLDIALRHSLTKGIVSYVGRMFYDWTDAIQIDAWGAPGCSGGPVFNVHGEVIGIVVAGPNRSGASAVVCEGINHIREAYEQANKEYPNAQPLPVVQGG